jgi:hypothetical protein
MGRHVSRFSGAVDCLNLAREFVEDCVMRHKSCPSELLAHLPTRLIDVRMVDSQGSVSLALSEYLPNAPYAALSHCWGRKQPLRLTTASLDRFKNTIPWSSLPETFQDAITVTRHLNLQYLWIDSLCIIQDSRTDWEIESARMASVYRGSYVTILASSSAGSEESFLA